MSIIKRHRDEHSDVTNAFMKAFGLKTVSKEARLKDPIYVQAVKDYYLTLKKSLARTSIDLSVTRNKSTLRYLITLHDNVTNVSMMLGTGSTEADCHDFLVDMDMHERLNNNNEMYNLTVDVIHQPSLKAFAFTLDKGADK